jgi:hypothetical protein
MEDQGNGQTLHFESPDKTNSALTKRFSHKPPQAVSADGAEITGGNRKTYMQSPSAFCVHQIEASHQFPFDPVPGSKHPAKRSVPAQ